MTDETCPAWCPYRCIDAWKAGHCLIRKPETTRALKEAYERETVRA